MNFPATHWTMLANATLNGGTVAEKAMEEFVMNYREPVMALLRRRRVAEMRIEDLTHDFFIRLMKSSALKRADRNIGPFRRFLCGMLTNFLSDDAHRNGAIRRGGGKTPLSLDGDDGVAEQVAENTDIALELDRAWALHVVARALETVRNRWLALEKPERFAVLRAFLPGAMESVTPQEAAVRLGMSNEALRKELQRLRDSFREAIRAEVAGTVSSPSEIAEEMRHLSTVLRSAPDGPEISLSQSTPASS